MPSCRSVHPEHPELSPREPQHQSVDDQRPQTAKELTWCRKFGNSNWSMNECLSQSGHTVRSHRWSIVQSTDTFWKWSCCHCCRCSCSPAWAVSRRISFPSSPRRRAPRQQSLRADHRCRLLLEVLSLTAHDLVLLLNSCSIIAAVASCTGIFAPYWELLCKKQRTDLSHPRWTHWRRGIPTTNWSASLLASCNWHSWSRISKSPISWSFLAESWGDRRDLLWDCSETDGFGWEPGCVGLNRGQHCYCCQPPCLVSSLSVLDRFRCLALLACLLHGFNRQFRNWSAFGILGSFCFYLECLQQSHFGPSSSSQRYSEASHPSF